MKYYIGIDPGSHGAISLIDESSKPIESHVYNKFEVADILKRYKSDYIDKGISVMCALEKVHSMPRDGVKQAFSFGENYGTIKGALIVCGIPFQEIPPATWKREFSLIGCDKSASISRCKELFPSLSLLPTERCRKDSDGMAEAILIAEYGRRRFK